MCSGACNATSAHYAQLPCCVVFEVENNQNKNKNEFISQVGKTMDIYAGHHFAIAVRNSLMVKDAGASRNPGRSDVS